MVVCWTNYDRRFPGNEESNLKLATRHCSGRHTELLCVFHEDGDKTPLSADTFTKIIK